MGHDYCHRHECLCYRGCPDCNPRSEEKAALSAAPSPVTVEGGGNAVPQTLDEIIENSLRMWYFNYDPSLDHTAARIAMREIIRYVIDVARVSPASPSPAGDRDALIERLREENADLRSELYRRGQEADDTWLTERERAW